ncbi:hypothetical protein BJ165DRAFT_1594751 [Panaeolus papilionaceus]|nr:hypothetical protein BJ165DRAFT_1594751 [Panaeolus papilionaceus]
MPTCQYCPRICQPQGIKSHERACPQNPQNNRTNVGPTDMAARPDIHGREQRALLDLVEHEQQMWTDAIQQALRGTDDAPVELYTRGLTPGFDTPDANLSTSPEPGLPNNTPNDQSTSESVTQNADTDIGHVSSTNPGNVNISGNGGQLLLVPEIKLEMHPHCHKDPVTMTRVKYCEKEAKMEKERSAVNEVDERPWRPFRTRLDFEVAELMLNAHMNSRQIDTTISLIQDAIGESTSSTQFTLTSRNDLNRIWDHALAIRGNGDVEYSVWSRSTADWCRELLTNKSIVSHFEWDAVRIYHKENSNQGFERIYDEPWTSDSWWEVQSSLPTSGKPFGIILYADKTRLSSFGHTKGHPVLVRCANLPVEIRNGEGAGGGRLIGWLPIISELSSESGKQAFVNHKREVWHQAVSEIFDSLNDWMQLGTSIQCGDGVVRQIFPRLLMISADYEEQSDMALTRGARAHFPCPVCLVFKDDIPKVSQKAAPRTTERMRALWTEVQEHTAADRETSLQAVGLRDVQNIFWGLRDTDIYSTLSWDRLHAYHGGLFSDHLLEQLKEIVDDLPGRQAETEIDRCLTEIPPWPGLNRFSSIHSTGEMSDGSKFEDFGKIIIYASLGCITPEVSQRGFRLLKLVRSYQELDQFTSLTLQSESTLKRGWDELKTFESALAEYIEIHADKMWDFPKVHMHQHVFDDIRNKGATRNYNTKPNEKANGPLKKFYQRHTNFKNVAPQILKISDKDLTATIIRNEIRRLDDKNEQANTKAKSKDSDTPASDNTVQNQANPGPRTGDNSEPEPRAPNVTEASNTAGESSLTRAEDSAVTETLTRGHAGDEAFSQIRRLLAQYLARSTRPRVVLSMEHEVTPFQVLNVYFSSVVNWRLDMDILRVNPNFHGRARFDFAILNVDSQEQTAVIVQLLFLFQTTYDGRKYDLALVLPFDELLSRANRGRDTSLRLTRLHPRRRRAAVLVDVNAITRGALLAPDPSSAENEMILVDLVDEDMWMRFKSGASLIDDANLSRPVNASTASPSSASQCHSGRESVTVASLNNALAATRLDDHVLTPSTPTQSNVVDQPADLDPRRLYDAYLRLQTAYTALKQENEQLKIQNADLKLGVGPVISTSGNTNSNTDTDSYITLSDGAKIKISADIQKWGAWCQINISPFILPQDFDPSNRPTFDLDDPVIRYASGTTNQSMGLTGELYAAIPERYHPLMALSMESSSGKTNFVTLFRKGVSDSRSYSLNRLRSSGAAAEIFELPVELFSDSTKRRDSTKVQELLGAKPIESNDPGAKKMTYSRFPPVLCRKGVASIDRTGNSKSSHRFLNPVLFRFARVALFGPKSVNTMSKAIAKSRSTYMRPDVKPEPTPGFIAWVGIMARYCLSHDKEMTTGGVGDETGINYKADHEFYKRWLYEMKANRPDVFRAIVASYEREVFATVISKASQSGKSSLSKSGNSVADSDAAQIARDLEADNSDSSSTDSDAESLTGRSSQATNQAVNSNHNPNRNQVQGVLESDSDSTSDATSYVTVSRRPVVSVSPVHTPSIPSSPRLGMSGALSLQSESLLVQPVTVAPISQLCTPSASDSQRVPDPGNQIHEVSASPAAINTAIEPSAPPTKKRGGRPKNVTVASSLGNDPGAVVEPSASEPALNVRRSGRPKSTKGSSAK